MVVGRERLVPGMRAQLDALHAALVDGMPRLGWKIGINVPEVQARFSLSQPTIGWLDGRRAHGDRAVIPASPDGLMQIEPELALRVNASAGTSSAPRLIVSAVAPAFEIVDYAKPAAGLDTIVAHSMFHAGTVLGRFRPLGDLSGMGTRWPRVAKNGRAIGAPRADLVPTDLDGLVTFVESYLREFGEELRPGDIVLSGSFMERAVRLETGSRIEASFGALGHLEIGAR